MLRLSLVGIVLTAMFAFVACSGGNGDGPERSTQDVSKPTPSQEVEASIDDATPSQPEESTPEVSDEPTTPSESTPTTDEPAQTPPEPAESTEPATSPPADEETVASESTEEPEAESDEPTPEEKVFAVADTKAGLTKIGATKCKMCHKIQYASWAESKHAALSPQLDCESCHGSGSEYKKKSIMEDPAAARAAGLVMPGADFCANCHQENWTDDMLQKSHAHKEDDSG